jgi:hypothetical protein
MAIYRSEAVDRDTYPKIISQTAGEWPPGAVAHFAGFGPSGFCVVDVWEDRAHLDAYLPNIRRVVEELGVPWAEPEVYDMAGLVAADTFGRVAAELAPV